MGAFSVSLAWAAATNTFLLLLLSGTNLKWIHNISSHHFHSYDGEHVLPLLFLLFFKFPTSCAWIYGNLWQLVYLLRYLGPVCFLGDGDVAICVDLDRIQKINIQLGYLILFRHRLINSVYLRVIRRNLEIQEFTDGFRNYIEENWPL